MGATVMMLVAAMEESNGALDEGGNGQDQRAGRCEFAEERKDGSPPSESRLGKIFQRNDLFHVFFFCVLFF